MMQTLDFNLNDVEQHREFEIPNGYIGCNFRVDDGKEEVILTIDGKSISMAIGGARDLALALRQSANRIERLRRSRR